MGMDDFVQKMVGEIVYVQLFSEGKIVKQGVKFVKMEFGKWLGKVYVLVSGELVVVNEVLEINFELINEDCYGKGWLFKIKLEDLLEFNNLIYGNEVVEKWVLVDIEKYVQEK